MYWYETSMNDGVAAAQADGPVPNWQQAYRVM